MAPVETAERDGEFRDTLEDALNNLAFIGSNLIARPNEKPSEKRSEEHREKRDEQPVGEPVEQRIDNAADVQRTVHASSNETAAQDIETIEPSGMAGPTAARPIEETVAGNAGISGSTDFLEQLGVEAESAPPPNLRDVVHPEPRIEGYEVELIDFESLELEPREPLLLPPETALEERIALERKSKAGRQAIDYDIESLVDLDSVPPPTLAPVKSSAPVSDADPHAERVQAREPADTFTRGEWEEEVIVTAKRTERFVRESSSDAAEEPAASTPGFSSSLITNQTFKDKD
jgi:hypothetical protein